MNRTIHIIMALIFHIIIFFPRQIPGNATEANQLVEAKEIVEQWIIDGKAYLSIKGKNEIKISTTQNGQMTIWCPKIFEGPVTVEFACLVPEVKTKLLLLVYGYGIDGKPIWEWERNASYDNYNSGPMEVYTIGFNRGVHTYKKYGDELANVRRIGGPQFADFTMANFKKHREKGVSDGSSFWQTWNTLSLLGAAKEPINGIGKYFHYRIRVEPPHIHLEVDGIPFGEFVDHRPNPLKKGAIAFRCMSKGKAFYIRNLIIKGRVVESKNH